jgi:tetratricopeptide (TPR) repeat protein
MAKYICLFVTALAVFLPAFSQKETRERLREGNKLYDKEKFTESEIAYRKALESNSRSSKAIYNLGNALYKQEKYNEALQQYQSVVSFEKDKQTLAKAWHNIGNVMMSAQDYQKSVDAYKTSLINNPNDHETRYNLAVAQKLLKEQQQQQEQNKDQNKDQQKKQEQEKQDQQKDKKQDQQDKQDQQQDQQDRQQQDQQNKQQQNQDMNKEKAEQILNALSEDEKKTQNKVREAQKIKVERNKSGKDW